MWNIPFSVLLPDTLGGINNHLAKVDNDLVGLLLGGKPACHLVPVDSSKSCQTRLAPEGGDGGLAGAIVGVLGEGGDLAHSVAKVLSDGIRATRLKTVKETLEDTGEEVSKLVSVDLGQGSPKNEAGLLEASIVEAEGLLAGLHEIHNVGLELLGANGIGDAAHGVADGRAKGKRLLAVLDGDVLAESAHNIVEVGLELLATKSGGDGANGTGGGGLHGEVLVTEELTHRDNQLGAELVDQVVLESLTDEGVEGTTGSTDDSDTLLVGGAGDGLEVGEEGADEFAVLGRELVGHLVGEVDETDKGSVTDRAILVVQELKNNGQQGLELGGDEVRSTLGGSAERENGRLAVTGVGVLSELSELLEQRHNDLARRQVAGQLTERFSRGVVIILVVGVDLGDDLHALGHEQSTHVLHGLELHAAVAGALAEESQGLRAGILLDVGVDGEVNHEVDEVLEVGGEEGRVVAQEGLEDLKHVSVVVIVALGDGVLEDLNHGLDELLDELHAIGVLLRVDDHQKSADGLDGSQADLSAGRVDDGLLDEAKKLSGLLGEVGGVVVEESIEDVGANLAVGDVVGGVQGQEVTNEVLTLAILKVEADGAGQKARLGAARGSRLVVQDAVQDVLLGQLSLVGGKLRPVSGGQAQSLDGGQLTDGGVIVGDGDLDQQEKGLGLGVVVLLQLGRDGLDLLGVGWRGQSRLVRRNSQDFSGGR
ncbi:hypothetical protein ColKHC_07691 [Colletotrichum higginsianum]|nr:hypothetical protein ColKHC_07691 [Colletotrichum higginsianum]